MSNQRTTKERSKSASSGSSKKIIRILVSYLFSFLLALSLLVLSVVCIAGYTLSEKYAKSCLSDSYFSGIKVNVEEAARDYTIPTGLDTSVVDNVFEIAKIRQDIETYIDNTFKIRKSTLDTSAEEARLRENVLEFLAEEGVSTKVVNPEESEVELDAESVEAFNNSVEETKRAVDEYVSEIISIYQKRIKLAGLDYLVKIGNDYHKYFPLLLIISILVAIISCFLCLKVHHLPHRGLRYLVYGFSGGFMMVFLAPFIAFLNGFYNRLGITPDYFKVYMVTYIKGVLAQFMIVSQIWLLIAIILGVVVLLLRKKAMKSD